MSVVFVVFLSTFEEGNVLTATPSLFQSIDFSKVGEHPENVNKLFEAIAEALCALYKVE
jgi:hypothetical protein